MRIRFVVLAGLAALGVLGAGCSSAPARGGATAAAEASPKEQKLYYDGLKLLGKNDPQGAIKDFKSLLEQYPTTLYLPRVQFSWGQALEAQKKYGDAAGRYKKAAAFYEGTGSANGAQALYRLSLCYEAVGDDSKTVLTLLELQGQKNFLSSQVAETELPARLAGAYARQGNMDQAKIYYGKAEAGLKRLRGTRLTVDTRLWLPKTLYSMGRLAPPSQKIGPADFHNDMNSLVQAQGWLVRCAELNENPWSLKSSEELSAAYDSAWDAIDKYQAPTENTDTLQAMKSRQEDQRSMAADLDAAMEQLKLDRLPSTPADPEPAPLTEAFKKVASLQERVNILLREPDVQDEPTPEAQKRQGLKKEGEIKH